MFFLKKQPKRAELLDMSELAFEKAVRAETFGDERQAKEWLDEAVRLEKEARKS